MNRKSTKINAFTLAEVLITLGVIGVVAALTMPTLLTNIQERVRKEQVRTVKYKLTKATEKMNSLGKIGHYDSTKDFVDELKNHLSIAKICDSNHLGECWGGTSFTNANGSTTYTVADLKTGRSLEALQFNSGDTDTVGIVTGDGTPIILTYGKDCQALDETKQYQWSTVDGKPETNATAGCVSMVFDINGQKGPNKIGTDVRTMNSLLGMVNLGTNYTPLTPSECEKYQDELGIQRCGGVENDYFAGAMKACHDLDMHLPSMATISQIATYQYGAEIVADKFVNQVFREDCSSYSENRTKCISLPENYTSPLQTFRWRYWASAGDSDTLAWANHFEPDYSVFTTYQRDNSNIYALCLAD